MNRVQSFGSLYQSLKKEAITNKRMKCYCCNSSFCKNVRPSIDHLIPVSHRPSGRVHTNNLNALAVMCIPCNSSKRDKPFLEFAAENPQIIEGLKNQSNALSAIPYFRKIAIEIMEFSKKAALVIR